MANHPHPPSPNSHSFAPLPFGRPSNSGIQRLEPLLALCEPARGVDLLLGALLVQLVGLAPGEPLFGVGPDGDSKGLPVAGGLAGEDELDEFDRDFGADLQTAV